MVEENETEKEYTERLISNPLHVFQIMKRFNVDLPSIEKEILTDDWKGTFKN